MSCPAKSFSVVRVLLQELLHLGLMEEEEEAMKGMEVEDAVKQDKQDKQRH